MTYFWPYIGSLDATGKILTLDSEGPIFTGDGTMAKYQDIIELVTHDHCECSKPKWFLATVHDRALSIVVTALRGFQLLVLSFLFRILRRQNGEA